MWVNLAPPAARRLQAGYFWRAIKSWDGLRNDRM